MIKCVAFDFDGTLFDYEVCNRYAENKLYKYLNKKFGKCDYHSYLYKAKLLIKKQLKSTASSHNRLLYMQTLCELLDIKGIDIPFELYNIYWDAFFCKMKCYSYVRKLFKYLKSKKIKIGILTDLTALIQYRKLIKLKVNNYIDFIVTSEEIGKEKPSKLNFKKMLDKAKCKKNEMLYIGDDKQKDYISANKYGMKAILFNNQKNIINEVIDLL